MWIVEEGLTTAAIAINHDTTGTANRPLFYANTSPTYICSVFLTMFQCYSNVHVDSMQKKYTFHEKQRPQQSPPSRQCNAPPFADSREGRERRREKEKVFCSLPSSVCCKEPEEDEVTSAMTYSNFESRTVSSLTILLIAIAKLCLRSAEDPEQE